MKTKVEIGTDTLLSMAKNLLNRGEITQQQYDEMVRRNNQLSKEKRKDIIEVKEKWKE